MNKTIKLLYLLLFLVNSQFLSQTIKFKGKVLDSLNNPLSYSNIIAEPKADIALQFAISDEQGNFQLKLVKDSIYIIKVSYLGFKPIEISHKASKSTTQNFILKESKNILQEVKISAKLAVSVKKDTIAYLTDNFITGEERKLRDVLKKLPGVEVDRKGNVFSQGKRVTRVLVENKQFFTGDSKLAVNNIPANAVNEVEILENYNEVAILKGLEDSNELAMNIKLKEDKKKFWFGDVEIGIGLTDRKVIHPSLFYYSPKKSMNFIGDLNNTGKKSFTFKDYLDFEGGYNKTLLNPKAYFSKLNDDFSQFLTNNNFKNSNHTFGGFNINYTLNDNTDLIGYTIYSKSDNELENQNNNIYLNNNNNGNINEFRIQRQNPKNEFVINKITLDNTQEDGTKFKATSFLKYSKNNTLNEIETNFNTIENNIFTNLNAESLNFRQDLEFYKSITEKQTITFLSNFNYSKGTTNINWNTNNNVFQNLVPIIDESNYSVFKDKNTKSQNASSLLKHYWVLGDFLHLYTTLGADYYNDNYFTDEYQQLADNSINNFGIAGFGNDINFKFINSYIGSNLKFQKGKLTFNTGLFYHNYLRSTRQFNANDNLDKKYVLPEFTLKYNIKRSEKISFRYNLKVRFPAVTKLINNFTLTNFNSTYRGNSDLDNELYHQLSLYYYKFSVSKKLNYNLSLSYRKTSDGIKNTNTLEGINFISEPILIRNADENISFNGNVSKNYGNFKLSLNGSNSYSKFLQVLNTVLQTNTSKSYSFGGSVKTNFFKLPNFEFSYKKSFDNYFTELNETNFENENLEVNVEYDFLNDFIFKSDYSLQKFVNKSQNSGNNNDFFNASLYYQKENSLWGFEISANNILDNRFRRNSYFTDFLISDNKTFILPRIIMLKISYKLD